MTRMQFTELCLAILKVVSLSSITLILPAYVCVVKEAETSISRSSTPTSDFTSTERSPSVVSCHSLVVTCPESLVTDGAPMVDGGKSQSPFSSPTTTEGPVTQMVLRMKGALARLQNTIVGHPRQEHTPAPAVCDVRESAAQCLVSEPLGPADAASPVSETAMVAQHGASHDETCILRILEKLLSSGNIDQIAKNLIGQVQGVLQDSGASSVPVAASKSTSDSKLLLNRAPKRPLSASQIVCSYAEVAIKDLLKPYLLPLVAWNAQENLAPPQIPISGNGIPSSSHPTGHPCTTQSSGATNTIGSLLGLDNTECSCLLTSLIQRLPANISYPDTAESFPPGQVATSPSRRFSEVANLFTQVMTSEVMDMVDSELRRHAYQNEGSSVAAKDEPRTLSSPDKEEVREQKAMESCPTQSHQLGPGSGHYGGLFSGLIQRFLAKFRYSDSALSDAGDGVKARASSPVSQGTRPESSEPDRTHDSATPSQKLKNMLDLFTEVMVSQVMDVVCVESNMELDRHTDQAETGSIKMETCNAEEQLHSASSRTSSSKSAHQLTALLSDDITDRDGTVCDRDFELRKSSGSPSLVGPTQGTDSSDNGCLVTVLVLQLLAKMKDQQATSPDMMGSCQDLIEKLLSEFSGASGTPNLQNYPSNTKIQAIYKTVDKFLQKEIGPETILQRAVNTQDVSFDKILLTALGKELRHECDPEVTAAPSAPSASPSPEHVSGAGSGQTARKMPKMPFSLKVQSTFFYRLMWYSFVFSSAGQHVDTPAPHGPSDVSVEASGQKPRKRSFFSRVFTCCFQGSAES
ncbi:hypothetical protein ACEWY4_002739 [Coilia grayii]|uniref:Uncharacterized protein n=1 Tax=Coilia grayii TaxID=363190 RepID=A0ABD1KP77_9TELE